MSTQNKTAIPNSLNEHWMPFTSNKDFKENPRLIVEAKGVYLKKPSRTNPNRCKFRIIL